MVYEGIYNGTYAHECGWAKVCAIPEYVAVLWIKEARGVEVVADYYLNKAYTVVDEYTAIAVYRHDFGWYLVRKDARNLTERERFG